MKYMCRTCQTECDDIPEHIIKIHKFPKTLVESQLKAKKDCYDSSFDIIKK
jgi:hypothetical protein